MKGLEKALEDTQMWGLELWDLKDEENEDANNKFNELVGEEDMEDDDEEEVKVTKPEKPIFAMNADEICVFFGQLLKDLYKLQGQVKYKLWAKKDSDGNVDTKATKSGGPNIGNKLKVVSAHLLEKLNIDYNTFAESVPSSYRRVEVNFVCNSSRQAAELN